MTVLAVACTLGGLVLLAGGGELLLRGAVVVALRSGLSPLLIGLTIVAFATSAPELLVTVAAGLNGTTDIGVGNVVGSNIANVLLILGAAALIRPIETPPGPVMRDTVAMITATAVFIIFAFAGTFSALHGLIMLLLLTLYIAHSYRQEKRASSSLGSGATGRGVGDGGGDGSGDGTGDPASEDTAGYDPALSPGSPAGPAVAEIAAAGGGAATGGSVARDESGRRAIIFLIIGLIALGIGSELLVMGASTIARAFGISEAVIGLTLVAFGTSLPELATAVIAALRGHSEFTLGNVLGSNIFNILLILGCLALIVPFQVSAELLNFDIWIMAAVGLLVIPVMVTGRRVSRVEGAIFIAVYVAYIVYQFDPSRAVG